MDEMFNLDLPDGERPDLQICIFPHLKEFLAVDLRQTPPKVSLLNVNEIFDEEFFRNLETEFSESIREETDFPFAGLINLPLRMEEVIREVTMTFILDKLGFNSDDEEAYPPAVMALILSGGALAMHSERIVEGLRGLIKGHAPDPAASHWEATLNRLISEENKALKELQQLELTEALRNDSPDYFSLWENRN